MAKQKDMGQIIARDNQPNELPSVTVDYEFYEKYLEESGWTEDQKREFLQILWNIICEFVSLGWGVHPLQQAKETKEDCGKPPETEPEPAKTDHSLVHSLDSKFIKKFIAATGSEEDRGGKGVRT
tara:strand:- start:145 stop:519 length:375 start_codon:yes stop_codon:yes gene_type:complete